MNSNPGVDEYTQNNHWGMNDFGNSHANKVNSNNWTDIETVAQKNNSQIVNSEWSSNTRTDNNKIKCEKQSEIVFIKTNKTW